MLLQLLPLLLLVAIILFIVFATRKKKAQPFPADWRVVLERKVPFYAQLPQLQKKRFESKMMQFLSEVTIEGVQTEVTDDDRIYVAASAVIPIFGFENWSYNNLSTVLLYPDSFNRKLQFQADKEGRSILGMVGTGNMRNQMILSKKALHHGFDNQTDKHNTAIHEFVHLVDGTDGMIDGIPERLLDKPYVLPWVNEIHRKMEEINDDESDIRRYGGTSQVEFFAVASEYFFSRPKLLKRKHPELYKMLQQCFNQDLASKDYKKKA